MDGLRGLGAQCGQPSQLSQVANSINAPILQDSNLYKQQINNNNPIQNTIEMKQNINHPPQVNPFIQDFNNKSQPPSLSQPISINNINQTNINPIQTQTQTQTQKQLNNNQTQLIYKQQQNTHMTHPQQQHINMQHPTMYNPMMQFQQMENLHMMQNQMFNIQNQLNQLSMHKNIQNKPKAKPVEHKSKEKDDDIKTTEEQPKTDIEVQQELDNIKPSKEDINQINNLLNTTKNDKKMANSDFMKFLRNIKDKNENKTDLTEEWKQDFNNWQNPDVVDNMNWESYLEAINPDKNKTDEYDFSKDNHFINDNNNNNDGIDYFEEGKRLMNEGNLNEAILAFEACLKKDENRPEAWRLLGQCHADNENEQGGIQCFMKCNKLDPYDLDALLHLGVSYTNEIDPYRALKYLKTWIANHPDYSILADQIDLTTKKPNKPTYGGWMGSKDEHKKVVNLFLKAININNKDIELHTVLGVLYNITSEYDKAEIHFKKAIQINPKNPSLWNKLGATQANGNKPKMAMKAYSRALKLKPNYVRALSNLGISFANQDMHREACQSYLASLKLNPNADGVWDHLTMSLMHLNRSDLVQLCKLKDVNKFKKHFDF